MKHPAFVISLDFELFWGVAESATIDGYGRNVSGVWNALPQMLSLFRRHHVHATWATVGMVMCSDYRQWRSIRPDIMPGYFNRRASAYACDSLAREHPGLFFARPLVQRILDTPGQELATHTYSHFFCGEPGATPEQFTADMQCAIRIARELNADMRSMVFPRNQVRSDYLELLPALGIEVYRGNPAHWLYQNGHRPPGGLAGRAMRLADAWLPLVNPVNQAKRLHNGLFDVPASQFLRPWNAGLARVESLRKRRLLNAMTNAARGNGLFHLWWHPHNFGLHTAQNMAILDEVLSHYQRLRDKYGMRSMTMREFAKAQEEPWLAIA
jgi:peptidoglycan/xylan/chitin deacetylase (PgdA/CDA1 family)